MTTFNCLSRLNLTAAHWAQLGTIFRDWSWPILDKLIRIELSWSRSIYVKWVLQVEYDVQLLGVSGINFLPYKIVNIMPATTSNLKSCQNQFCWWFQLKYITLSYIKYKIIRISICSRRCSVRSPSEGGVPQSCAWIHFPHPFRSTENSNRADPICR